MCLPGLARTADDFGVLAGVLRTQRRIIAIDYRGRGKSDFDTDWRHYDLVVENADVLTQLTALGVDEAFILGTSRGGMHAMLLSATRPALLRGVILNDIGPVLEKTGLMRIRNYVGKLPAPSSWDDACDLAKRVMSAQFSGLNDEAWEAYARLTFEERDGRFSARYDPNVIKPLEALDLSAPLPDMWAQFAGLANVPVLALRGEHTDLLSTETLAEMKSRHKNLSTHTVAGQGHAPLLLDAPTIEVIGGFIAAADG